LVTHDRFLLDRVSTIVFGLDGLGGAERFADYFHGKSGSSKTNGLGPGIRRRLKPMEAPHLVSPPLLWRSQLPNPRPKRNSPSRRRREFELMEKTIHEAEAKLQQKLSALNDPDVTGMPQDSTPPALNSNKHKRPWKSYTLAGRTRRQTDLAPAYRL